MSDPHGIGNAMRGMVHVYISASRHTGRTTAMLDTLKDHDVVVFMEAREADRVKRLARERGLDIETRVVPVERPERLVERQIRGRMVLDHSWVEQYYLQSVDRAARELDNLQSMVNDNRTALQTERARYEKMKWIYE